jgi:hypothetical protein
MCAFVSLFLVASVAFAACGRAGVQSSKVVPEVITVSDAGLAMPVRSDAAASVLTTPVLSSVGLAVPMAPDFVLKRYNLACARAKSVHPKRGAAAVSVCTDIGKAGVRGAACESEPADEEEQAEDSLRAREASRVSASSKRC